MKANTIRPTLLGGVWPHRLAETVFEEFYRQAFMTFIAFTIYVELHFLFIFEILLNVVGKTESMWPSGQDGYCEIAMSLV